MMEIEENSRDGTKVSSIAAAAMIVAGAPQDDRCRTGSVHLVH